MNHQIDTHQRWKERQLSLDVPTIARRMADIGIPFREALWIIRRMPALKRHGAMQRLSDELSKAETLKG